jgi:hypothetical protein
MRLEAVPGSQVRVEAVLLTCRHRQLNLRENWPNQSVS